MEECNMRKTYLHRVAQTAILTAVLTVLSQIAIPTPWNIPFTLQTFGIALCGYLLGPWYGTASIVVYIALGAIGVPVFSGFKGSIGALAGMTGGYIFGFLFMALLCGLVWKSKNVSVLILLSAAGLFLCHLLGAIWFAIIGDTTIWYALSVASLPYLAKDIISIIGAYLLAARLRRHIPTGP